MERSEPESGRKPKLLFVDDDPFTSYPYVQVLEDDGFDVTKATTADQALVDCTDNVFDAVIMDVRMNPGSSMGAFETKGGFETGIVLARRIKKMWAGTKVIALTNSESAEVVSFFTRDDSVAYFFKPARPPLEFSGLVRRCVLGEKRTPRVFIVHGRDSSVRLELKNFLQNRLGFPEPIILSEQPSQGKTVIEKFEHYASRVDLAFVVMTPDDVGCLADDPTPAAKTRARQNVTFEYGYFLGSLKRLSGRVILLYKGPLELPSDIAGIVYIDISGGIDSSSEPIRSELAAWL